MVYLLLRNIIIPMYALSVWEGKNAHLTEYNTLSIVN